MNTAVLRPQVLYIVLLVSQVIVNSILVLPLEVIDELLDAPPRRRDEVDGISSWVLFPFLLQYLCVVDASLVQFEPFAAAREDAHRAVIEHHDQILSVKVRVVLHCLDHFIENALLGV